MNEKEIQMYRSWLMEIDRYPDYLEHISPTEYQLRKFLDYIGQSINDEITNFFNPMLCMENSPYHLEELKDMNANWQRLKRVEAFIYDWQRKRNVTKPPPVNHSFNWTGSPEQLDAFYDGLVGAGYIDKETGKEAFKAVFSGNSTNDTLHRVTWIKRAGKSKSIAKNAVITMFDLLAKLGKISEEEISNRAELFRKLQNCFCDKDGKPLKFEHKHCSYSKDHGDQLRKIITSL